MFFFAYFTTFTAFNKKMIILIKINISLPTLLLNSIFKYFNFHIFHKQYNYIGKIVYLLFLLKDNLKIHPDLSLLKLDCYLLFSLYFT